MRARFASSPLPWLVVLVLILDQTSKAWVVTHWQLGERLTLLSFFEITRAHNYGAAFSFLSDAGGWQRWLFVSLAASACLGIGAYLVCARQATLVLKLGLACIFAGALGNLIDRLAYGYVVDFVLVHLGSYPFPAFNIADSAITVGAGLVILDGLLPHPATAAR